MLGLIPTMVQPDSVIYALRPRLWLDARYVSGASGAAVATLPDRSGNATNATQAVGAAQPAKILGGANGPIVRFDGTTDGMATAAIDLTTFAACTLVAVADNNNAGAAGYVVVESSASYSLNVGAMLLAYGVTIADDVDYGHRGDVGAGFKVTTLAQAGMRRLIMVSDFSAAAAAEVVAYSNGSVPATADTNVENTGTSHGNHAFNIGARANAASLFLTGDISQILLFTRVLTAAEVAALDAALLGIVGP